MRSVTFVTNGAGEQLLGLALTCRTFGGKPSKRLGILDSGLAHDFDKAGALLLKIKEPDPTQALIAVLAGMFGSGGHDSTQPSIVVDRSRAERW